MDNKQNKSKEDKKLNPLPKPIGSIFDKSKNNNFNPNIKIENKSVNTNIPTVRITQNKGGA